MAKAKAKKAEKKEAVAAEAPALKYSYQCPACSQEAIQTSNKMLGVKVQCKACKKIVDLDNADNYKEI